MQSLTRRVAKNTLYSAVSEGSNFLLLLIAIFAARYLGGEQFGIFSFGLAFVGLFQILPDFGVGYANTIEVARDKGKAEAFFSHSLGLQLFLSVPTFLLVYALIVFADDDRDTRLVVVILAVAMLLKTLKATFRWVYKSLERFDLEALTLVIERGLTLLLAFAALVTGQGLIVFVLCFTGARVIDIAVTAWVTARTNFTLVPRVDLRLWREFIRRGFPFVIVGAMITVFFQIDAVMLSFMRTDEEVGWYSAAYKIIETLAAVPRVISYALLPTVSLLAASSHASITGLYQRAAKYLLVAALPICAYIVFRADELVLFVFGEEYRPSVLALQILIPSVVFMFQSNLGETILAGIDRWRSVVYAAGISVAVNIGLNLLLIPRYGYIGSGVATIVTELIYCLCIYYALFRVGHRISVRQTYLAPVAAGAAMAAVLALTRQMSFLPAVLLSCATFVATLLLLRCFDKQELQAIIDMISRPFRRMAGS